MTLTAAGNQVFVLAREGAPSLFGQLLFPPACLRRRSMDARQSMARPHCAALAGLENRQRVYCLPTRLHACSQTEWAHPYIFPFTRFNFIHPPSSSSLPLSPLSRPFIPLTEVSVFLSLLILYSCAGCSILTPHFPLNNTLLSLKLRLLRFFKTQHHDCLCQIHFRSCSGPSR